MQSLTVNTSFANYEWIGSLSSNNENNNFIIELIDSQFCPTLGEIADVSIECKTKKLENLNRFLTHLLNQVSEENRRLKQQLHKQQEALEEKEKSISNAGLFSESNALVTYFPRLKQYPGPSSYYTIILYQSGTAQPLEFKIPEDSLHIASGKYRKALANQHNTMQDINKKRLEWNTPEGPFYHPESVAYVLMFALAISRGCYDGLDYPNLKEKTDEQVEQILSEIIYWLDWGEFDVKLENECAEYIAGQIERDPRDLVKYFPYAFDFSFGSIQNEWLKAAKKHKDSQTVYSLLMQLIHEQVIKNDDFPVHFYLGLYEAFMHVAEKCLKQLNQEELHDLCKVFLWFFDRTAYYSKPFLIQLVELLEFQGDSFDIVLCSSLYEICHEHEDRALMLLKEGVEASPKHGLVLAIQGYVESKQNLLDQALQSFNQSLILNPKSAFSRLHRSLIYWRRGKHKKALSDLEIFVKANPQDIEAFNKLGNIYYDLNNLDKSLASFDQVIRLDPQNTMAYIMQAEIHCKKNNFRKALESLNQILRILPNLAIAYVMRGKVYLGLKQMDKALEDANTAFNLKPEDADVQDLLALCRKPL